MRSLGYPVQSFASAAEFLSAPSLAHIRCLIADVQMPAMSGIELHAVLIDTGRPIPTVLVTAFPDDVTRALAKKNGVICYLRKPLDEVDLLRCVEQAVDRPYLSGIRSPPPAS